MKTCPAWSALLLAGALTALIRPTTVAAVDSGAAKPIQACAIPIGDVTGDGVADFSVSSLRLREEAQLVYLLAGDANPLPANLDADYLRTHLAGVLRGPAAVPFTCTRFEIGLNKEIAGAARIRRPALAANTLIDQPAQYRVLDLNLLTPSGMSTASAVNEGGRVVGRFLNDQGVEHAFVYDGAVMLDLGTLGGHFSDARGINRHGHIVGVSLTGAVDSFGFVQSAFLTDGGPLLNLNRDWSAASAINDRGQIVGEMRLTPGVDLNHAFLYDQGIFTDLGSLPPLDTSAYSTAHAINNRAQVVGQSNTYVTGETFPDRRYGAIRPFLFEQGAMRDLGSLGARCVTFGDQERCIEISVATDINNHGVAVGFSTTPAGGEHAFVTGVDGLRDLGVADEGQSWAYGVNDSGQIVGGYFDGSYRPFIVDRGIVYDLNDLLVNPSAAAALPFAAYDIDNFGRIVGNHHVLEPIYQQIRPGSPLALPSALGQTFGFAYWLSRVDDGACIAGASELELQVRFDTPDQEPGEWTTAGHVRQCGSFRDWGSVWVSVPSGVRGQNGFVQVRVREIGPVTGATLHLRHFTMQ